jgi:hypothetical protein
LDADSGSESRACSHLFNDAWLSADGLASQKPLNANVFVKAFPVDTLPFAYETPIGSLVCAGIN